MFLGGRHNTAQRSVRKGEESTAEEPAAHSDAEPPHPAPAAARQAVATAVRPTTRATRHDTAAPRTAHMVPRYGWCPHSYHLKNHPKWSQAAVTKLSGQRQHLQPSQIALSNVFFRASEKIAFVIRDDPRDGRATMNQQRRNEGLFMSARPPRQTGRPGRSTGRGCPASATPRPTAAPTAHPGASGQPPRTCYR